VDIGYNYQATTLTNLASELHRDISTHILRCQQALQPLYEYSKFVPLNGVCVYVCDIIYVYTYIHMYTCIHAFEFVYINVHIHTYTHVHTYVSCIYSIVVYITMHTCIHANMHMCEKSFLITGGHTT